MQLRLPTMTSIQFINTLSDLTAADPRERSRASHAGKEVVEGPTLATLWKPGLRTCAQSGSPKPVYASQDLDLSARFGSGADGSGSYHHRQSKHQIGPNRRGYASPRG